VFKQPLWFCDIALPLQDLVTALLQDQVTLCDRLQSQKIWCIIAHMTKSIRWVTELPEEKSNEYATRTTKFLDILDTRPGVWAIISEYKNESSASTGKRQYETKYGHRADFERRGAILYARSRKGEV
jgi:hypothetical protein